jgi:hypothetical protein
MVRRHSASRSVDRRTVPSRLCISYLQNIHALPRRIYNPPSGTRPCDGCCTCNHNRRRRRSRGETGWRLCGVDEQTGRRVLWFLVRCRSRRASLFPFNPFPQSTHNIPHRPATHFQRCFPLSSPTTLQPCLARSDPWRRSFFFFLNPAYIAQHDYKNKDALGYVDWHRSFTRCPRARRFWQGANTSLVGLAKRRTSILVSILCANTLASTLSPLACEN